MQWINLQLDMLPAIAIQTAKAIQLYKNTVKQLETGHHQIAPKLKQLNNQLAYRVQQLDKFYKQYHFDDRIHLFHRLKIQLKKVLNKYVQQINNSYLQAQSLDVSKVRQQLALIESTLEKGYQQKKVEIKPVITVINQNKKSLANSKVKPSPKNLQTKVKPVSKLNLSEIRKTQGKPSTSTIESRQRTTLNTETKRKSSNIPSVEPSSRPSLPDVSLKHPKAAMQQLVFTIKMTKQQYLQFLQAKKSN